MPSSRAAWVMFQPVRLRASRSMLRSTSSSFPAGGASAAAASAGDGSGRNWIGAFLEPHPRNLRDPAFMAGMTRERLARAIADGLPDTSMPAWRNVLKPAEIEAVVDYVARAFYPLPPRLAEGR